MDTEDAGGTAPAGDAGEVAATLTAVADDAGATRRGLQADLAALVAATADANTDDEHDPEGATIAWERQQLVAAIARQDARLAAVDAARERLRTGRYGVCVRCGRPVAPARLAARPEIATCVACPAG